MHESGFGRKLAGSCLFALPVLGRTIILQRRESCHSFPHMPAFLLPATSVCDISSESRPLDRHLGPAKSLHLSPRSPTAVFSSAGKGAQKSPSHGLPEHITAPLRGFSLSAELSAVCFYMYAPVAPALPLACPTRQPGTRALLGRFPLPQAKTRGGDSCLQFFPFSRGARPAALPPSGFVKLGCLSQAHVCHLFLHGALARVYVENQTSPRVSRSPLSAVVGPLGRCRVALGTVGGGGLGRNDF